MNVLSPYKKNRFFLWVNILGLSIGLGTAIMLILFVVNELNYDKHFDGYDRIIKINTVLKDNDNTLHFPLSLKEAYTELPGRVPGIETVAQIYNEREVELIYQQQRFQQLDLLYTVPEFFSVFHLTFLEGTPEKAMENDRSVVITRKYAEIIFGGKKNAINKNVTIQEQEYTISAVVEELPLNTHFTFDILANVRALPTYDHFRGLEFHTYYLIRDGIPVEQAASSIIAEYDKLLMPFKEYINGEIYGAAERLTDIYLRSQADFQLGRQNNMSFVWLLIGLAGFILLLAVTNFINLFIAQGEGRMNEIGIRKANGAAIKDMIKQFFSEVACIVFIAFLLGILMAFIFLSRFSVLIGKEISLTQSISPTFIFSLVGLFIITITLSAAYPAMYLSQFKPLEILTKNVKLSRHRLVAVLVVFQSVITIVLISGIFIINKQSGYLKNQPLGCNPENVMVIWANNILEENYTSLRRQLQNLPEIKGIGAGGHIIGEGTSGEGISLPENPGKDYWINVYRILPGVCELMEFELLDGEFFTYTDPWEKQGVILNEAAVNMLGLELPVAGKTVVYNGDTEILGVVKNFLYGESGQKVMPLIMSNTTYPSLLYIRFEENVPLHEATQKMLEEIRKFDPDYILTSLWLEEIYRKKFDKMNTQSQILFAGSLLSLFIAMMGLLAIHLYTTMRRTREIGIRKVNGAGSFSIFGLLTLNIIKWIVVAGIIAVPLSWYLALEWLKRFDQRTSIGWEIFVIPVLIQCCVAILVTSGISLKALFSNPVEALKTE